MSLGGCKRLRKEQQQQPTCLHYAYTSRLKLAVYIKSLTHYTKGTPFGRKGRPTACHCSISGSISLSASSSFHLSFTVLVHYRSLNIFRLGKWSPPARARSARTIQTRFHVSRFTLFVWCVEDALLDYHHLWLLFQQHSGFGYTTCCGPKGRRHSLSPLSLATTHGISFDFLS